MTMNNHRFVSIINLTVLLIATSALLTQADITFTATVYVTKILGVSGALNGTMYYFYDTTTMWGAHWKRIDWNYPIGTSEFYDYQNGTRFKMCTSCDSESYSNPVERLFVDSKTDTMTSTYLPGTKCRKYTRAGDPANIAEIYMDNETTPGNKVLCMVVKNAAANGAVYVFSSYQNTVNWAVYWQAQRWGCPRPSCSRIMDIIILADVGSYISTEATNCTSIAGKTVCSGPSDWSLMVQFMKDLAAAYKIGPFNSTIGAVFFATSSRIVCQMTTSLKDLYIKLNTSPNQGHTCLGCGLDDCQKLFDNPVPGRTELNPERVVILMTSGNPNFKEWNATYEASVLKNDYNAVIVGVGIGKNASMSTIRSVCSQIPGVETAVYVPTFGQLSSIINRVVSQTCTPLPAQDCIGCAGYCSCGKQCVCPLCPPSGNCNVSFCDDATKACVVSKKDCDDGNACTADSCSPSTGCVHTPVNCDDNNACTTDLCSPASGCYHEFITCPFDACTKAICSVVEGCVNSTVTCDDGDPCTNNYCNRATGCYYVPISCYDGDLCTEDLCVDGACPHTPVNCSDGKGCTLDTCNPALGCSHSTITCDDGKPCTEDSCEAVSSENYTCHNDPIQFCVCEGDTDLNCSDAEHYIPCQIGTCGPDSTGYNSTCHYKNRTDTICNSGNKCILDKCFAGNDTCMSTAVVCTQLPCIDFTCNPETGACDPHPRVCSNPDPCFVTECNPNTDVCESRPYCAHQTCFDEQCVVASGSPECIFTERNCSSGSMCIHDECNNLTDSCIHWNVSCEDNNACTIDSCNPAIGCVYRNVSCDDGKLCTTDVCDPISGCSHPAKCDDGQWCTDDYCNPLTGTCSFIPGDCTSAMSLSTSQCYVGCCSESRHCYKQLSETAIVDVCGTCMDTVSLGSSYTNITLASSDCLSQWSTAKIAAVLSGAAIAGVVLAAIIAALIILAASSYGTYELVKRAQEARPETTSTNPLYEENHTESVSALYSGHQA